MTFKRFDMLVWAELGVWVGVNLMVGLGSVWSLVLWFVSGFNMRDSCGGRVERERGRLWSGFTSNVICLLNFQVDR